MSKSTAGTVQAETGTCNSRYVTPKLEEPLCHGTLPNGPVASDDPANFADRFGKWDLRAPGALGNVGAPALQVTPNPGKRSEADDDAPVRILSRVNLSSALASSDTPPLAPASASPLLGIYSGQPMSNYPVPPSIFQTKDPSSPDDDELFQRWIRYVDA